MTAAHTAATYLPRRAARSQMLPLRGLDYHLTQWDAPVEAPGPAPPLLVMVHGFMDVGASFQFVIDAMAGERRIVAPDWRGFGRTAAPPAVDAYWFPDYLGDLDALLDALSPDVPVDLLGHSLGGNVVMTYAGVRPQRIRRLVNLEGFGLPDLPPAQAAARLALWLDELKTPQPQKPYASLDEVATRMRRSNPRLPADKARWLAGHWAEALPDGRFQLRADPAHRRINPVPYRAAEAIATWGAITAPVLSVQGRESHPEAWWNGRYSLAEYAQRLAHVPNAQQQWLDGAGHMLHHDQPEALALLLDAFLA